MPKLLPQRISPGRLARAGSVLDGGIPLSRFGRLTESLARSDGEVQVKLSFHQDRDHLLTAAGDFSFRAELICQSCLVPLCKELTGSIRILLLDAEAKHTRIKKTDDVVFMQHSSLPLVDLLEDDLILSLPMVPRCEQADCLTELRYPRVGKQAATSPFTALKAMLEHEAELRQKKVNLTNFEGRNGSSKE